MNASRLIEKIKGFSCSSCKTLYIYKQDAAECCEPAFGEEGYTCPDYMCSELHETQEEAENCGELCKSCNHAIRWHAPNAVDRCSMFGYGKDNNFQYWECDCTEKKWKKVTNGS